MLKFMTVIFLATSVFGASTAKAKEIELDWNMVEVGFLEHTTPDGRILRGLAIFVPGNRIAVEDDFYAIVPNFCTTRLSHFLELSSQLGGGRQLSFLKLQVDFYGLNLGESETYIARSATIPLEGGQCSL